jgi:hypothetical protein
MVEFISSLGGRKFLVGLLAIVILVLNRLLGLGLEPTEIWGIVVAAIGTGGSIAAVDVIKAAKQPGS